MSTNLGGAHARRDTRSRDHQREGRRLLQIVRRSSASGGGPGWCCSRPRAWTWPRSRTWPSPPLTGPRSNGQLQRRRVRLVGAQVCGRSTTEVQLPERREIKKKVALSRPVDHSLPFSTWSLSKLAEFLVAEGVVDDISHEGLRPNSPDLVPERPLHSTSEKDPAPKRQPQTGPVWPTLPSSSSAALDFGHTTRR